MQLSHRPSAQPHVRRVGTDDENVRGGGLRVGVLGEVCAWHGDTELDPGSAQCRAVLGVLALRANETVSRDELIDAVWGERAPAKAAGSVYNHISTLRRVIGSAALSSSGGGYRLRVDDLDLNAFHSHRERARRLRDAGDPHGERAELTRALELWRGEALAGLPGPFAEAQRLRLTELRLAAVERHVGLTIDLGIGDSDELIDELRTLVADFPLREGMRELLITALTMAGRRADALAAFDDARAYLIEHSGTEPGPALRALHDRLRGVPANNGTRAPTFVGRRRELARLRQAVTTVAGGRGGVVWVEGEAGIGKSTLLAEGLHGAADLGCQVGWAEGDELTRQASSGVLVESVRALLEPAGADAARAWSGDRATLLDRTLAAVRVLCARGPVVLVVDDLHLADATTLWLLPHVHRATGELPLLVVTASRPEPELALTRASVADPLVLGVFTADEVRELVAEHDPVTAELVAEAAGNPMYLTAVIGEVTRHDPVTPAVERHLGALGDQAYTTLRALALLDEPSTVGELAAVTGSDVTDLVARLRTAGVLAESEEHLRFRYPVVRRVLRDGVPVALRTVLHRLHAERIATSGGAAERVAAQLLAGPVPLDDWTCAWLSANLSTLADNAPLVAADVLRYVHAQPHVPDGLRESVATAVSRLLARRN
jgi:DNA-binding SARP family transcriptional activator/CheY-like chemotaxis protein